MKRLLLAGLLLTCAAFGPCDAVVLNRLPDAAEPLDLAVTDLDITDLAVVDLNVGDLAQSDSNIGSSPPDL